MDRKIPAFPGAWGGGMFTTGGRGGKVIAVTNLDDSGPGSLRAAIEAEGPRIVVFRVAGIIPLKSNLDINNPDITIAGQIRARRRHLPREPLAQHQHAQRHPPPPARPARRPDGGQGSDNIGGNPERDIIVDHCSTSWGMDENLSLYRYMKPNPAADRSNIPSRTSPSSSASPARRSARTTPSAAPGAARTRRSITISLPATPAAIPRSACQGEFDFRNNVIFNWGHRTMDGGDETSLINVINNYYKPGPATKEDMVAMIARIDPGEKVYSPGSEWAAGDWYPETPARPGKWYVAGNIVEGQPEVTADNWKGLGANDREGTRAGQHAVHRLARAPGDRPPGLRIGARQGRCHVAAARSVDARVIEIVRTNKVGQRGGIVHHPDEVGGYPEYAFDPAEVSRRHR